MMHTRARFRPLPPRSLRRCPFKSVNAQRNSPVIKGWIFTGWCACARVFL